MLIEHLEPEHMRRYSRFVYGLYYLRHRFPTLSVTSWGRSAHRNLAVAGGKDASQHLEWTAADVVPDPSPGFTLGELTAAAREVGLEVIEEGDHLHIELLTNWH